MKQVARTRWALLWLQAMAWLHILGGIAWMGLSQSRWVDGYLAYLARVTNSDLTNSEGLVRLLLGLFGPTIASWGVLMWAWLRQLQITGRGHTGYFFAALLVWFLGDCGLSWYFGATAHGWLNLAALLALGIPALILLTERAGG